MQWQEGEAAGSVAPQQEAKRDMLVLGPLFLPSSTLTRLLQVGFTIYLLWVFSPQLTPSRNLLTDIPDAVSLVSQDLSR